MTLPSKYYFAIINSPDLDDHDNIIVKTWAVWSLDPIEENDPAFGEDETVTLTGESGVQSINALYQGLIDFHGIEELRALAEVQRER